MFTQHTNTADNSEPGQCCGSWVELYHHVSRQSPSPHCHQRTAWNEAQSPVRTATVRRCRFSAVCRLRLGRLPPPPPPPPPRPRLRLHSARAPPVRCGSRLHSSRTDTATGTVSLSAGVLARDGKSRLKLNLDQPVAFINLSR